MTRTIAAACAASLFLLVAQTAYALSSPPTEPLVLASSAAAKRAGPAKRPPEKPPAPATGPVVTVTSTGPGQAGYVHYFVITGPDGEPESQVAVELPGDRIAASFPEIGVAVMPFVAKGGLTLNGKPYEIEHRYGIRPFRDDESMRVLQRDLAERVRMWVEEKTPYCDEEQPSNGMCLSCLGFVLRVLYPAPTRGIPALPADFKSAKKNVYTTEDLLLYLAGISIDQPKAARLKRIESLAVPEDMREQLVRIASIDPVREPVAKPASATRSVVQLPKRVVPRRRS